VRKVLFIAYAFPPWGVVGALRPFKFTKYLPQFGWNPIVLSRKIGKYAEEIDGSLLNQIEPSVKVFRVAGIEPRILWEGLFRKNKNGSSLSDKSLNPGNNFKRSVKRFLATWLEIPDPQIGWFPQALLKALELMIKHKIEIIYSTSNPFTNHLVAMSLKRITKKPWVADFRDPWTQYPLNEYHSSIRKNIDKWFEHKFLKVADRVTVTSGLTAKGFTSLYPDIDPGKISVITNGIDPSDFEDISSGRKSEKFTITYAGKFFSVSSANKFLEALSHFLKVHPDARSKVLMRFIGLIDDHSLNLIRSFGLMDVIERIRYVSHKKSLQFQADSDVLLLTRSAQPGNEVIIPAKLFEYLAIGKPILALVPPEGEAAGLVRKTNSGVVVAPDDKDAIIRAIHEMYSKYERGGFFLERETEALKPYERRHLTGKLAELFDSLV